MPLTAAMALPEHMMPSSSATPLSEGDSIKSVEQNANRTLSGVDVPTASMAPPEHMMPSSSAIPLSEGKRVRIVEPNANGTLSGVDVSPASEASQEHSLPSSSAIPLPNGNGMSARMNRPHTDGTVSQNDVSSKLVVDKSNRLCDKCQSLGLLPEHFIVGRQGPSNPTRRMDRMQSRISVSTSTLR